MLDLGGKPPGRLNRAVRQTFSQPRCRDCRSARRSARCPPTPNHLRKRRSRASTTRTCDSPKVRCSAAPPRRATTTGVARRCLGDDMLLVICRASRSNVATSSARSRRPEGLRLVASPASTPLGAPSMTDDTVVCHVESHTRANSDTRRRRNREDGGASSPQWVRAPTISHLPWGLVPFDACRSEQRPTPGFQPRLCGAFRLSRPLDASFRSQPLRPCFMPVTPLGFRFRRFPLLDNRQQLSLPPVLHAVSETTTKVGQDSLFAIRLRGCKQPRSPFTSGRSYPVTEGRSSHSVHLYEVSPVIWALCFQKASSHGLSHSADHLLPDRHRHVCSSEFQRTTELAVLFREPPPSVRFVLLI
jgi:hypothetical protein